jgi:hypothetical protein
MMRTWLRAGPAVLVAVALGMSAAGPLRTAHGTNSCDVALQSSSGDSMVWLGYGLTQPIAAAGNVAACSLRVETSITGGGTLSILLWNPAALAPDPTTVALRSVSFGSSDLIYNHLRADFTPPVIVRQIPHLAEPSRTTVAADYYMPWYWQHFQYDPDAPPELPVSCVYPPGGARTPLAGPHPVVSHRICGGDPALQDLAVVQSVMTTSTTLDTFAYEAIQRFRVPAAVQLNWVELAFGQGPYGNPRPGTIAIYDGEGQAQPPQALPEPLVHAYFQGWVIAPAWASHMAFDQTVTLHPDHDYWLLARIDHSYLVNLRTYTGSEGGDFTQAIGPTFRRNTATGLWQPLYRALCFRLIGRVAVPTAVPAAGLRPGIELRVSPNPAREGTFVSWSQAVAPVRIDMVDAHGRRVSSLLTGGAAAGRMRWQFAPGSRSAPGVYLVRAVDGTGRVAHARLVLIR